MADTVAAALARARQALAAAAFGPSTREAALLLGHVLGLPEARLLAHGERPLTADEAARFAALLARRLTGEPVAYLLGRREFYSRDFRVDSRVLIPRPESEHLIAAALDLDLPPAPRLLDVGTGSGCLAVTLVLEIAGARAVATDRALGALALAAANARRLGAAERLALVACDLAAGLDLASFDLAVSNPPYIAAGDAAALSPEVRDHEPAAALFAGPDGLAVIRRLLGQLAGLRPGTPLLLEIGDRQAAAVATELAAHGFAHQATLLDYAGIQRVVVGRRSPWTASRS